MNFTALLQAFDQSANASGAGPQDWPDIPAAWMALGWLCGLRVSESDGNAGQ